MICGSDMNMILNHFCKFLSPNTPNLNKHNFLDLSSYLFLKTTNLVSIFQTFDLISVIFFSRTPTCLNWSEDLIWTWYSIIFSCFENPILSTLLDICFYIHSFICFFNDNKTNVNIPQLLSPGILQWSWLITNLWKVPISTNTSIRTTILTNINIYYQCSACVHMIMKNNQNIQHFL